VKPRHLVWVRRVIQSLFFGLFLFLLVESRLPQDVYLDYARAFSGEADLRLEAPVTFFFRTDPLVALTTLLSGGALIRGFLWAAGVLALTILMGRVFCGFICPFGSLHHAAGAIKPSLRGERMLAANRKAASQRIKYFLLLGFLISAVMGLNLAGLLDPIGFLFRSMALAVVPAAGNGLRAVFEAMAASDVKIIQLLSYGGEVLVAPVFGYNPQAYQTGWFIGLLFLVILFLNRVRPRFWCRVLCPLGALLGLCSRFTLLKLEKDAAKCSGCNLCTKHCQGAASPKPDAAWETCECLMCFNCFNVCPEDALAFRFRWAPALNRGPDIGRRAVLGGLLAGVSLPFFGRLDGRVDKVEDPRLIRPPGALAEGDFLEVCQRCGLCMKVCPTNVINPTLAEAGMSGFWTPRLIMTQGYCEYSCTLCGSVCPTGALRSLTAREKTGTPIKIGSAFLDRGRCLPWSGNAPCIVCQEHCPTSPKAIYLKTEKVPRPDGGEISVQLPYVDLKLCVGCGICEYKCPVQGLPAIRTISAGETRSPRNQILL
jgi:polyferredoxin